MSQAAIHSSADVRTHNRNRVYRLLHGAKAPMTKQDIAYALSMSLPTLTQNLQELLQQGLIDNATLAPSDNGRRPRLLRCVPQARWAVGAELEKGGYRLVAVDLLGHVRGTQAGTGDFPEGLEAFLASVGLPKETLLGVGLTGAAEISLPYPVQTFSASAAGGFGALWGREGDKPLVYLSLGQRVEGAVFLQGVDYAAQLGHAVLHPGGAPCSCGRRGCVEVYCTTQRLMEESGGSLGHFFARLDGKDALCKATWNRYLENLTLAIHNLSHVLSADIVLGGDLALYLGPRLVELLRRLRTLTPVGEEPPQVSLTPFPEQEKAQGAALRLVEEFIEKI